jgi:phage anti-repressor protein
LEFIEVVKKYKLLSKEHNGDYLIDSFDVETRFASGLDAINIAPEFGQIESEYYLEVCKNTDLFEELYEICYNSGKWKKWVKDIERISKEQIIMICCHYVLSYPNFIEKIKSQFPDADKKIQKRINSQLKLLYEQTKNYCI